MRRLHWITAALFAMALPATALAQSPASSSTTDNTMWHFWTPSESHLMASAFVGANFGGNADKASPNFGADIAYLHRGVIGAELLADFAPGFRESNDLTAGNPSVNAYMANAILSVPIGHHQMFQPFVSGGIGGIQTRSNVLNIALAPDSGETHVSHTQFGWDVGAGAMGFKGMWGLRADVRYFTASHDDVSDSVSDANYFAERLFDGIHFWRADIGISLRW